MLNRRILRIKAFKVLYSYAENRTLTLKEALADLDTSCEATRDLYLYMLSIVGPRPAAARMSLWYRGGSSHLPVRAISSRLRMTWVRA